MEISDYPILFRILLILGISFGFTGGWIMQKVAVQVDKRMFNMGALFMLFQDILIAFFYIRGIQEIMIFILIIFLVPAAGFLLSKRYSNRSYQ